MAKSGGKVRQKPPRAGKRLGVKIYGGQKVKIGNILVRQRGSVFHPGEGTKMGRDFSIYAIKEGTVNYKVKLGKKIVEVI